MQHGMVCKERERPKKKLICYGHCCCCCFDQNCYFLTLFGTLTKRFFRWVKVKQIFLFHLVSCRRATMSVGSFSLTIVSHIPLMNVALTFASQTRSKYTHNVSTAKKSSDTNSMNRLSAYKSFWCFYFH